MKSFKITAITEQGEALKQNVTLGDKADKMDAIEQFKRTFPFINCEIIAIKEVTK